MDDLLQLVLNTPARKKKLRRIISNIFCKLIRIQTVETLATCAKKNCSVAADITDRNTWLDVY